MRSQVKNAPQAAMLSFLRAEVPNNVIKKYNKDYGLNLQPGTRFSEALRERTAQLVEQNPETWQPRYDWIDSLIETGRV